MSEIKVVIQLLCHQLNLLLKTELKPENFRLAKFNNNDENTIKELWEALWKLSKSLGASISLGAEYPIQFAAQIFLMSRNYDCVEFYCVPWDNSTGSREVLLALMWLIASDNTLSKLVFQHVRQSPLCQEYPECFEKQPSESSSSVKFLSEDAKVKLSTQDKMNYSLWLASQVKNNLNKIHELDNERIKKTHMIHQATSNASGLPHLSVFETKLVHDPEFLKEHMPDLKILNDLLDSHTKWSKTRSIFWEWMETVVDLKEKDVGVATCLQPQQEKSLVKFREALHIYITSEKSKEMVNGNSVDNNLPRFFINSLFMKSASKLIRKASSSDLLSDVETSDRGVVAQAADLLSLVDSNLQELEQLKTDRVNELHASLNTLAKKMGAVIISDLSNVGNNETESEDCSK